MSQLLSSSQGEREIAEKDIYCILKACEGVESSDITVKTLHAVNEKCYGKGIFVYKFGRVVITLKIYSHVIYIRVNISKNSFQISLMVLYLRMRTLIKAKMKQNCPFASGEVLQKLKKKVTFSRYSDSSSKIISR